MDKRYETFTGLILNISRYIQKIKNVEMSKFGLKGKQVQCLFALYNLNDGASATKLAEICKEDKGAMSRTISELEKDSLVYIEESEKQKYKVPIKLTDKGKDIASYIANRITSYIEKASNGITDVEREILYATLGMIYSNLTLICSEYGE